MNSPAILGALAIIPLATGPLPEEQRTLTMGLCLGGEITIPIDGEEEQLPGNCHQLACHAGNCRQKMKPDI